MPRKPYAGPIIDAHHHLWDLSMARHPWLAAQDDGRASLGDLAPIRRDYLPEDYRRDAARHDVVASVHVEAGWAADDCLGETRWLETLDKSRRRRGRATSPMCRSSSPDASGLLEAQAAYPRVVGVRDILSWDADPARRFAARDGLMDDAAWRAGLASLAVTTLVFDLMVFPRAAGGGGAARRRLSRTSFSSSTIAAARSTATPRGMQAWRDGLARRLPGRQRRRQDLRPRRLRP